MSAMCKSGCREGNDCDFTHDKRETRTMNRLMTAAVALAAMVPAVTFAQAPPEWQFGATLFIYLPTLGGKMAFPRRSGDASVSVSADKIIDNLNAAFMG